MDMISVNVSELRNNLSRYLGMVRKGKSILIRDRDRVVARIEPAGDRNARPSDDEDWLDRLERGGLVRRGRPSAVHTLLGDRPVADADVVEALLHEREDGR